MQERDLIRSTNSNVEMSRWIVVDSSWKGGQRRTCQGTSSCTSYYEYRVQGTRERRVRTDRHLLTGFDFLEIRKRLYCILEAAHEWPAQILKPASRVCCRMLRLARKMIGQYRLGSAARRSHLNFKISRRFYLRWLCWQLATTATARKISTATLRFQITLSDSIGRISELRLSEVSRRTLKLPLDHVGSYTCSPPRAYFSTMLGPASRKARESAN
jgi:hypothetical protein